MKKSRTFLLIGICGFIVFGLVGCFKGKKIIYTNPEKNISVELSEDQIAVTGTLPLGDGSSLTISEEE